MASQRFDSGMASCSEPCGLSRSYTHTNGYTNTRTHTHARTRSTSRGLLRVYTTQATARSVPRLAAGSGIVSVYRAIKCGTEKQNATS